MQELNESARRSKIQFAMNTSLIVNVALLCVKVWALIYSGSMAVVASVLDSVLDIFSQMLLCFSECSFRNFDPSFPVGKTRLTPVSILICSTLMFMGALEVIQESTENLIKEDADIEFGLYVVIILSVAIALKIFLYVYCRFSEIHDYPSVETLGDDHRNDILTNLAALVAGTLAYNHQNLWWVDPVGGIIISVYIAWAW
eukprot:UN23385